MPALKPPTPQGISALLRRAGFERAVISITGGSSGFKVEQCRSRPAAVKVRQYFLLRGPDQRYREALRRYRDVIETAGYRTEMDGHVSPGRHGRADPGTSRGAGQWLSQ